MKHIKLLFIFIVVFFISSTLFSQTENQASSPPSNEIGADIIPFIQMIFNFNSAEYYIPYRPKYYVTYKRYFKHFNFRFGVGGSSNQTTSFDVYANEDLKRINQGIDYRIGLERKMELFKRWGFYYGLDLKNSNYYNYTDNQYYNGGWRIGYELNQNTFGLSPFFGLEFSINEKIAIQTEANFIYYWTKKTDQPIIVQIDPVPSGDMPSNAVETDRISGSLFNPPNFLVLVIKI